MTRRAQPWLGTLVDITIADALAEEALARCFEAAFSRIAEIHRLMSFHATDSALSAINRAAVDTPIAVDADTLYVIETALRLHQASDGIFNIACAGQLVAWDMLPSPPGLMPRHHPSDSGVEILRCGRLRKTRPVWLDLGGIAKGYAVDQAIAALRDCGVTSACVNAGGDVRVLGQPTFPIFIRDPDTVTAAAARVDLSDAALATSGSYFSRHAHDGAEVSALLDGRTGSAFVMTRSASVIAPECMIADALTKVVLISGDPDHPILARFGARAFIL